MASADAPPRPEPRGPPPDTYSLDQLVTVTALRPGQVIVHLALRRVWEKDNQPLEGLDLEVAVTD
jgi:hypothetical protein